jgi:hypothetical protein
MDSVLRTEMVCRTVSHLQSSLSQNCEDIPWNLNDVYSLVGDDHCFNTSFWRSCFVVKAITCQIVERACTQRPIQSATIAAGRSCRKLSSCDIVHTFMEPRLHVCDSRWGPIHLRKDKRKDFDSEVGRGRRNAAEKMILMTCILRCNIQTQRQAWRWPQP